MKIGIQSEIEAIPIRTAAIIATDARQIIREVYDAQRWPPMCDGVVSGPKHLAGCYRLLKLRRAEVPLHTTRRA